MSVSSVTSSGGVIPPVSSGTAAIARPTTTAVSASATDTVTLSDAAKATAAFRSTRDFNSFVTQLGGQINEFEHQVTWQLDHNTAVTSPVGVAGGTGSTGSAQSISTTIADGIAGLESINQSKLASLTPAQQAQLQLVRTKLATELNRFQGFAARRASSDAHKANRYAGLTTYLGDKINAYEHQVTWQIDHGAAVTSPKSLSATPATSAATAPTAADTIAAGFTALEADVSNRLGHLSTSYAAEFQQLQQRLTREQARFTSFAARRAAYRAANPSEANTRRVTA